MTYDIIIIWWWASWLFCALNTPKESSKLIIEKQWNLWTKVLMSGWWRCNFSNTQISLETYFGENKKMLPSIFHKFSNHEIVKFLENNWVQTQEEDNGRFILKSGKAQELLNLLVKKTKNNNTDIKLNQDITNMKKEWKIFTITTQTEEFRCKKLVVATWGVSYPQTWTTWYWLNLAKQFGLKTIKPYPALCWIETKEDLNNLSGSSIVADLKIFNNSKIIYQQKWTILFTHRWLSGPTIFNATTAIWEYLTKKWKYNNNYIQTNTHIEIDIPNEQITKRLSQSELFKPQVSSWTQSISPWDSFGKIAEESKDIKNLKLKIKNITNINMAKVSWGWISMNEINPNFESKKIPNLYFIGETLDITGQTWWFNLQRAWSSGFVCGNGL